MKDVLQQGVVACTINTVQAVRHEEPGVVGT
jgi:hypothetical protein